MLRRCPEETPLRSIQTFRIKTRNKSGTFARFTELVARVRGQLQEIETVHIGRSFCVREVTVELDAERLGALVQSIAETDGLQLLGQVDRVFALHEGGKIASRSTLKLDRASVLRSIYTPGVAQVCLAIKDDPTLAMRYTSIGRTVAVVTNGTRVLGLGNIGTRASMPVMEGKAALYSELVRLNAVPILVNTENVDEFVKTVVTIASTFGGIHLEDISSPACFAIERALDAALDIPVMHDDRHGTGVAALAGLLRVSEELGLDPQGFTVAQIGLGAAGVGIAELMLGFGVRKVLAVDKRTESLDWVPGAQLVTLDYALANADVVIATTGVPGLIKPSQVKKGQIIFALSNPDPEIDPDEALAAGAAYAVDGAAVNNLLGFPGLFRGAMMAEAPRITLAMKIAAAKAIAARAPDGELLPDALDRTLHTAVTDAVHAAALAEQRAA